MSASPRLTTVSVLTPVLNEERFLPEVVERMRAQRLDGTVEFLFMDGRSTDRTRELLETYAAEDERIRVLDNPARHTAAALNIGLWQARGRYVARMDAHTLYPPTYLRDGIRRLEQGGAAWVCGPQVPVGKGRWSSCVADALGTRLGVGGSNRFDLAEADEIDLDTGVFTGVWKHETLARYGGWDEGWPVNQDSELAARMLHAGERIVSRKEMGAEYVPRDSPRALARQYFRYGRFRAKTTRRHPETFRPSMVLPPAVSLLLALSVVPGHPASRAARRSLLVYATALGAAGVRVRNAGRASPPLGVTSALAIMHLAWGSGFLVGLAAQAGTVRP